jgi:hypothetical protein
MRHSVPKMGTSLSEIASRTGLSEGAVHALRDAIIRGRGVQAQFDHPELGGMGQWMRGGMVMVGDMFNSALAAKVSLACALLSELDDVRVASPPSKWWPDDMGRPSQSASQDSLDYAFFPSSQRLAVRQSGAVTLYDLSGVTFRGVGAQSGRLIVHTSTGPKALDEFPRLERGT